MKRRLVCILLLAMVLPVAVLFSSPIYMDNMSKDIRIYGFIYEYCNLFVSQIDANTNSSVGMPFDITDSTVRYVQDGHGREIASWSFATNLSYVKLTFNATPMHFEDQANYPSLNLGYSLFFSYIYQGYSAQTSGYIEVPSTGADVVQEFTNYTTGGEGLPIISMDNDLRFMFDSESSSFISSNVDDTTELPEGFYYATVTISMEAL